MHRRLCALALLAAAACRRPAPEPTLLVFPGREEAAESLSRLLGARVAASKSYLEAVESLGAGSADGAFLNDFGYLLARDLYAAEAELAVVRFGNRAHKGALLAPAGGAGSVADLAGKRVVFSDPYSTTGFLVGAEMLRAAGVKPASTAFAGSHEEVVRRLYRGEADAGATFYNDPSPEGTPGDGRRTVLAEMADVADKVRVIATSAEIPNEPLVFR